MISNLFVRCFIYFLNLLHFIVLNDLFDELLYIEAESVGYIEAHGTATRVGDSIEAQSLKQVFGSSSSSAPPIPVGSVKSSILIHSNLLHSVHIVDNTHTLGISTWRVASQAF